RSRLLQEAGRRRRSECARAWRHPGTVGRMRHRHRSGLNVALKLRPLSRRLRASYCSRFRVSLAVGCGDCGPAPLTRGDLAPYPSSMRPVAGVSCSPRLEIISPSQPVMPAQAKRAVAQRAPKFPPKSRPPSRLGVLPEWNLADLYAGIEDPQVKRDLDRAAAESLAFEEACKGKLAALVERPEAGSALAAAVKRYQALDDLLRRLPSHSRLLPAGHTPHPPPPTFHTHL